MFRPGQQSEQTPGQFLNWSLQEQVTGTQEHTGQAGQLGDGKDHLQHDKMFRLVTVTNVYIFNIIIYNVLLPDRDTLEDCTDCEAL